MIFCAKTILNAVKKNDHNVLGELDPKELRQFLHSELLCAAEFGRTQWMQTLLPYCMPIHSAILQMAALYGNTECVKLLIPVSDPKANDSKALRMAVMNGYTECVRLLVAVADPIVQDSDEWHNSIMSACRNGFADVIGLVLSHICIDMRKNNSEALRVAALRGHNDVVDVLWDVSDVETALRDVNEQTNGCLRETQQYAQRRWDAQQERAALFQNCFNQQNAVHAPVPSQRSRKM